MNETILSTSTKMSDLASKKEQVMDAAANILAAHLSTRSQNDQINESATMKEINNLLNDFTPDEQSEIKTRALVKLAMVGKFGHKEKSDDKKKSKAHASNIYGSSYLGRR